MPVRHLGDERCAQRHAGIHKRGGYFDYGAYISDSPLSAECLNWVWAKKKASQRYIDLIDESIDRDKSLLVAIDGELSHE